MIYPPNQKPPIWSIDPGVIAYNCQKAGMPHPVLAMPMWEGAGELVRDYSRYRNHGVNNGADWVANGLDFDGSSYVDAGTNIININKDFSLSVWINIADITHNSYTIFGNSHGAVHVSHWIFMHRQDIGGITWQYDLGVGDALWTSNPTQDLIPGVWQHAILVRDQVNSKVKIYLDAKVVVDDNINPVFSTPTGLKWGIGSWSTTNPGVFFKGGMNAPYLFDAALTTRQVKLLHNDPYFMYQIPEELYGYSPVVVGAIMNQFQKHNVGADLYNGAIIA